MCANSIKPFMKSNHHSYLLRPDHTRPNKTRPPKDLTVTLNFAQFALDLLLRHILLATSSEGHSQVNLVLFHFFYFVFITKWNKYFTSQRIKCK